MSRGYRIRVPAPQVVHHDTATATGTDELCIEVGLLPILGVPEMCDLLREALAEAGWIRAADGTLRRSLGDGLEAELEPDASRITVSAVTRSEVEGSGATRDEAARVAAVRAEAAKTTVTRQSTARLARAEADVRATLEEVVQRVYVQALEKKARSMGDIQSIHHGTAVDGTVEVTIKIRV
jgi:hypothetical protein